MVVLRVVADAGERNCQKTHVAVGVGKTNAGEVPAEGQSKDDDLESGDEELEDEETWVAVDSH